MRPPGLVLLRSIFLAMTFVVGCVIFRFGVSEYSSTNQQDELSIKSSGGGAGFFDERIR